MKKIFASLASLSMFGFASLALANMTLVSSDTYLVSGHVDAGWNIIQCFTPASLTPNSEIKESDLKVIWAYVPQIKEYVQIYPDNKTGSLSSNISRDELNSSSCWVYSSKSGSIEYKAGYLLSLSKRNLYSGWNFVTLTPEFKNKKQSEWKGSCNVEKYAIYDSGWKLITPKLLVESTHPDTKGLSWGDVNFADSDSDVGKGVIMYVSNDCNMKINSGITTPPAIPNF